MANVFNPQYPQTYPQYQNNYMPSYYNAQQMQNQNHNTSVVWVQGLAGAQAYPVAAGNTMMLMDSEDSVFYMKSTDNTGRPLPLRAFEFHEKTNEPQQKQQDIDLTNYVTWDAFEKRLDELEARKQLLKKEGTTNGKSTKRTDE